MSYRYPLAAVLRVRELVAEQEELKLARIHAEIDRIKAGMRQTEVELAQAAETRKSAFATAALPAMHLHALYAATDELHARGALLRKQLATFEDLRRRQVLAYTDAYQKRELMASLREKDRAGWSAERDAMEERAATEAFLARAGGKSVRRRASL
jgi:hypothetical protein